MRLNAYRGGGMGQQEKIESIGNTVGFNEFTNDKYYEYQKGNSDAAFDGRQYQAVLRWKRTSQDILIMKRTFIIGKNSDYVDFCISGNNAVSRIHANIQWDKGRYFIHDCNSVNGTYVNGQRITAAGVELTHGSNILFANEAMLFYLAVRPES